MNRQAVGLDALTPLPTYCNTIACGRTILGHVELTYTLQASLHAGVRVLFYIIRLDSHSSMSSPSHVK